MKASLRLICFAGVLFQSYAYGIIQWQPVPGTGDSVAYEIINNQVRYVHPDNPGVSLPRGLFFLKSKENEFISRPKGNLRPAYTISNGVVGTDPYVYSDFFLTQYPKSLGYVYWQTPKQGTEYAPSQFIDPSRATSAWRENLNTQLANTGSSSSMQQGRGVTNINPSGRIAPQPSNRQTTALATAREVSLKRDQLFDDVMGMSEYAFKEQVGFNRNTNQKPSIANARRVISQQQANYPRANAIMIGEYSQPTLGALKASPNIGIIGGIENPDVPGGVQKTGVMGDVQQEMPGDSSINLIVHNPANPKETDIRYLHERFPGAYFLIASNFNALEGGMGDYSKNLSGMNYHPVQGEEAAMATMPATIYRRYLLEPINFLEKLNRVFTLGQNRFGSPIITGVQPNARLNNQNALDNLSIGLHENIIVSSGYNDDNATIDRGDGKQKPAYNKQLSTEENKAIQVSHIYAAAHDLNRRQDDQEHIQIARRVLKAVYEATILAAIDRGAETLVLTMIGASAFKNNPDWIIEALRGMRYIIAASNLQIYMVVRGEQAAQNKFAADMRTLIAEIEQIKEDWRQTRAGENE